MSPLFFSRTMLRRICVILLVLGALQVTAAAQQPAAPVIPAGTFPITRYGAVGDGRTMNTAAFRQAIEACERAGGGSVIVPAGVFLTGPMRLGSHMALVVEKGGTIQASGSFSDFGLPNPLPGTQAELDAYRDAEHSLINGENLTDVAIRGEGTIDGAGAAWWAKSDRAAREHGGTFVPRPNMIVIRKTTRLEVSGVTLSNSPQFHLVPHLCTDVLVDGIKIKAPPDSPNTDGVDPSNCRNVLIRHITVDNGDDDIAFKANHDGPLQDVLVTDCTFFHGHGVSVGSETSGGVRNIVVQRCTFEDTGTAIRIKSARSRGGVIENVTYRDITMKNVDAAIYINMFYDNKGDAKFPQPKPVTDETPHVRGILLSNITCQNAKSAGEITALPEAAAAGVTLENVRISAWSGFSIQDAEGLQFKNVSIITSPKPTPTPTPAPTPGSTPAKVHVVPKNNEVTVALDGSGDCGRIQDAIDAAPAAGARPFVIHIKPGSYFEILKVPHGKCPIRMEGEDAATTIITGSNAAGTLDASGKALGTFNSATVFIDSDDFSASGVTFQNSTIKGGQALAISVGGDRAVFRKCRFEGWQDTVLLREKRQYFEDCKITGAVDFIFGAATAYFLRCEIRCAGGGYITAASTPREQAFGFVFDHCTVTAEPGVRTYLGRPWRPYASVTWLNTSLPDGIRPEGWDNWRNPANEQTARFGEFASSGPGADAQARAKWAKSLNDDEAGAITLGKVLGGWIANSGANR